MRPARLVQSSGFRIAGTFTLVFLVAAAIAGATGYSIIKEELTKRHKRGLAEDYAIMQSAFTAGGLSDLQETITAHANASRNRDGIYLLRNLDGSRLAGNIDTVPSSTSGDFVDAASFSIDADYGYFVKRGDIGGYEVIVGSSAEDISELEEIFVEGSLWAASVLFAISFAGAVVLSQRMNRRIEVIQGALELVADGKFNVRIPMTGHGDDIDMLSEKMNSTVSRLGASVESIRQISNDISHDLKTPLNRLRINLEEALERQAAGKSVAAEIEEASDESNRIIRTFDALLRIAQIESRTRRARFTDVNFVEVMADITDFYQTSFEDAGLELIVNLPDTIASIHGDRELLTQLVANLLENAMRHCPSGARITCAVAQRDNTVVLSVSDNGDGIPVNERENVLRRLYRLEKSRTTPGSGLGLSMVKAIADVHAATLSLEDNEPGLLVVVGFPVASSGSAVSSLG